MNAHIINDAMINNFRSNGVTTHLINTYDSRKTMCGRTINLGNGAWGAKSGRLDEQFACKSCLNREEAPCEIETVQGTKVNHKMTYFKNGNGICTKCGREGHL